jgi:hypothetical protein
MSKIGEQAHYKPKTSQKITVGAASAKITNAVGAYIQVVRILSTSAAYVKFGATGDSATASDMIVPANVPEYFTISAGQFVHALQVSAAGTMDVTEMTQ